MTKLSWAQVVEIRRSYVPGMWRSAWAAAKFFAAKYGVRPGNTYEILKGRKRQSPKVCHFYRVHDKQRRASELPAGFESGFLRVIRRVHAPSEKNSRYLVECRAMSRGGGRMMCGRQKEVARCQLVRSDTRSCGCMKGALWRAKVNTKRLAQSSLRHLPIAKSRLLPLVGLVPTPHMKRVRGPRRRCPMCFKSKILYPAVADHDGEYVNVGRFCRSCCEITDTRIVSEVEQRTTWFTRFAEGPPPTPSRRSPS